MQRGLAIDGDAVSEADRLGGTAVILLEGNRQPLDPLIADLRGNLQLHQFALFTPVLRYDADLNPLTTLVERWDTVRVALDTLLLTFRLCSGVRWHDGTPPVAKKLREVFGQIPRADRRRRLLQVVLHPHELHREALAAHVEHHVARSRVAVLVAPYRAAR